MPEDEEIFMFSASYTQTGTAKVCVEAKTEAEARQKLADGDIYDVIDADIHDTVYDSIEAEVY